MNVSCPECRSVFRVDPTRIPATGVRARCSVCGGVIILGAGSSIEEEFGPPATLAAAPSSQVASLAPVAPRAVATPPAAMPLPEPALATPVAAVAAVPIPAARTEVPPRATPQASPPPMPRATPAARPAIAPPIRPTAFPPRAQPAPPLSSTPRQPAPAAARAATPARPLAPPIAPAFPPRPAAPSVQRAPSVAAPAAPPARAASPTPARLPINPFLANDPNAKARRLSRALISDLVTYFPQRRDEGLRDGTLRELFRDEIKKSYEEYVEQVGKDLADSTSHFQDALNEILAGGQKIF